MQFTPQQLTGGPKYHHATRIGNWSEDQELEEIKLKDYLKKKETGTLITTAKQQQLAECLQPAQMSASTDGVLQFGHRIQVVNHQSKCFLAVNPYDTVAKSHDAFMLTTGPDGSPTVRNIFEIERVDPDDGYDDDYVHYGQNIRIKLEQFSNLPGPAYMHSEMVTALAAAKFSRHQEVVALCHPIGETKWQILWPDVNGRFEMEGEPVQIGQPMVIRHVQTGSFLASDEIPYQNIFGAENEVHCFTYQSLSKTQNLTSEKKGEITGDYALRKHGMPNIWQFLDGSGGQS